MTTIACLLLIGCGIIGMFASPKTFLLVTTIVLLLVAFTPVVYRYSITRDGSLVWEAVFRAMLFMIAAWGAKEFIRVNNDISAVERQPPCSDELELHNHAD